MLYWRKRSSEDQCSKHWFKSKHSHANGVRGIRKDNKVQVSSASIATIVSDHQHGTDLFNGNSSHHQHEPCRIKQLHKHLGLQEAQRREHATIIVNMLTQLTQEQCYKYPTLQRKHMNNSVCMCVCVCVCVLRGGCLCIVCMCMNTEHRAPVRLHGTVCSNTDHYYSVRKYQKHTKSYK